MGTTDKFGNIRIARGLSEQDFVETLRHESVHRFFSPKRGPLRELRADFGYWAYEKSHLVRFVEEAIAEGYGVKSFRAGLRFPFEGGYELSKRRVLIEAGGYVGGTVGASYFAYEIGR